MASAGRVLIIPKGDYDENSTYEKLDLVNHNGMSWLAKKTSKGIEPTEENTEHWQKMCEINIANNLVTETEGYALDARQGKVLNDKIVEVSDNLGQISHAYNQLYAKPNEDTTLAKLELPKGTYIITAGVEFNSTGDYACTAFLRDEATLMKYVTGVNATSTPAYVRLDLSDIHVIYNTANISLVLSHSNTEDINCSGGLKAIKIK